MTIQATLADDKARAQLFTLGTIVVTDANQGYVKHFQQPITIVNRDKNVTVEVGYAQDGKTYFFDGMLNAATKIIGECEALIASGRYGNIKSLAAFTMPELFSADKSLIHCVSMKTDDYSIYADVANLDNISQVLISDLGIPNPY